MLKDYSNTGAHLSLLLLGSSFVWIHDLFLKTCALPTRLLYNFTFSFYLLRRLYGLRSCSWSRLRFRGNAELSYGVLEIKFLQ
jgi:hypothetical protein